jgi:DNA adenine methylase
MNAPVRYYGSKGGFYNKIIEFFPTDGYDKYIEPFAGTFIVGLKKPITKIEVYNDMEKNVYSLYKVISDKELFQQFKEKCDLVFYSEDIRKEFKEELKKELSIVDRAFYFFYVNRTSHNGIGGFSMNTHVRRGMSKAVSDFLSAIDRLPELHDRLSKVIVTNTDGIKLI